MQNGRILLVEVSDASRASFDVVRSELARERRCELPQSSILLDLDLFKGIDFKGIDDSVYAAKVSRVMAADDRGKTEDQNGRISLPGVRREVSA